jgi:serine/threonine-protein kinase HipA
MSIGGHNKFGDVTMRHIERFAKNTGTDSDRLVARTREMATNLPTAIADAASKISGEGLSGLRDDLIRETRALAATLDA